MAEPKLFLQSVKDPSKEYEVLEFDPVKKAAVLQGIYAPFEMAPFTKEAVTQRGYKLVRKTDDAAPDAK